MTVGELFDGSLADAAPLIRPGHLVFDWSLIKMPWSASAFRHAIEARDTAFGPKRWPANVFSNHDQPRHASWFEPHGSGHAGASGARATQVGDARAKVAATMLLTLRGTPFLYYGEEIALRNLSIPNADALDPPARRANALFPWWNRDQARGPMPWTAAAGAGFSTGRPWLPLPPDAARRNVAEQAADPDSVLNTYRRVLRLRRATPALQRGDQQLIAQADPDALVYVRQAADSNAVVALNFGSRQVALAFPGAPGGGTWHVSFSTSRDSGGEVSANEVLAPMEALVATA